MTARWVVDVVKPERDLQVTWQPISLYFKNEPEESSEYHDRSLHTHKLLRVMQAVTDADGNDAAFEFYWEAGRRIHHDQFPEVSAAEILEGAGLDPSHAQAYDDDSWDPVIRKRMDDGLELVGDDVGTPIIGFPTPKGKQGFFGPVITRAPSPSDGVALWDAMVTMATMDGFWELKRTRTERPDFGERP